jgi:phthalate 4,5-cis-dihydrodiol dehydrogenase
MQLEMDRGVRSLTVGLVGLGAASSQVLPFFGKVPNIRLGGAADIRPDARERFAKKYNVPAYESVEAICRSKDIDALWIATPNELHADHTVLAARHGKHVICEKPMAVTIEDCDRMIAAAVENRVKLIQGHSKIYNAPIRKMREIIASGVLGQVVQIDTWNYNDWLQRPRLASEVDTSCGGGICYRQGPHQVDIVRYLAGGRARSVRAITGRRDANFDTEGNFSALLDFDNGVAATMSFNGYGFFDVTELTWDIGESGRKITRTAERSAGRITRSLAPEEKYSLPASYGGDAPRDYQPFFGLTVVNCEKGALRQSPKGLFCYDADGVREISCGAGNGRGDELTELLNAVNEDREAFPDGRWGKATLEVCVGMLNSSRDRREIMLEHQTSVPQHI